MSTIEIAFWSCVLLTGWTYAGYPLLLALLARARPRPLAQADLEPAVSVIVAAYNEEKHIGRKLQATLALDYPRERLEVIVASDGSTDRTNEIVDALQEDGVRLLAIPERRGKTAAQNAAAREARGEFLVFTDATTRFRPDALRQLLRAFADPRVGCVGADLQYLSRQGTLVGKGCGLYWRYEKRVKELESAVNSLIGVSGCLYAIRARLYTPIEPDLTSDFTIALDTFAKGYLTVHARGAVAEEDTNEEPRREFDMRTRVIVQTIHALVRRAFLLNPIGYGLFALQLWSHKVLRYLVPELLAGAFLASLALALQDGSRAWLYEALVAVQAAACLGGLAAGWASQRFGLRAKALFAVLYFAQANAAALWALVSYLRGERKVTWTTAR
jgi:cellulose synthase/poly-beta-1,6-N-acetylglucosamine synthase-like glycosyltransferase